MKTIRWNTKTGEVTNFDKLLNALEDCDKSLRQVAYYIRSAEDYQFAVNYYRQEAITYDGFSENGGASFLENLQRLPLLMTGYKEKFILSTF
jgi:hypothetical protein